MIRFSCENCGRRIKIADEYAGKKGNCPNCKHTVIVPKIENSPEKSTCERKENEQETNYDLKLSEPKKRCPFCGEEILDIAKKCKHCGEFLESAALEAYSSAYPVSKNDPVKQKTDIFATLCFTTGLFSLVIFPIVFIPICLVTSIISSYQLKEKPDLKGKGLCIAGIIFCSISLLLLLIISDYFEF